MEIRHFRKSDTPVLIDLFRKTVHTVCKKDYSPEQLDVWAPAQIDADKWSTRFTGSFTVVAENGRQIAGFANLEADGCIDMLYVAAEYQGQGVGSQLIEALEKEAQKRRLEKLHSDVSLTARPFFLSKGFAIEQEYSKKVGAVTFPNSKMAKKLH